MARSYLPILSLAASFFFHINSVISQTQAPQAPGGPQDSGGPVIILETGASATGAYITATLLDRSPADPEHATDRQMGRNFHWDSNTNSWVDSKSGKSFPFAGYLSVTSGPEVSTPTPIPSQTITQPTSPSSSRTSMGTTGAGIQFQLRGFGGASFVNGNTPATAGFDGAVLFPLGNNVLVGPTAGFQWVNSSIVKTIGGGPPPSTFIHTSVGFKQGNFGGRIGFPFGGWQLGIQGGATVAGSTITQEEGFTGNGTVTGGSSGSTETSTTTTHETVVGPFVGGYISHSIFSHVGIFVEFDYHNMKVPVPSSGSSGASSRILDLHYSDTVAGFNFTFGHH